MMRPKPISTHHAYRRVLAEIEGLMSARRNTSEGDRLDVLVTLVEAWEAKPFAMGLPDAVEAIKFRMEQGGLEPADLVPFIGSLRGVREVLAQANPRLGHGPAAARGVGIPAASRRLTRARASRRW